MRRGALLIAVAAALVGAGCGGDDETPASATTVAPPVRTDAPPLTRQTTPTTAPDPTAPVTIPPETTTAPVETTTDGEELPPPDTPEGRFERFCLDNPRACE